MEKQQIEMWVMPNNDKPTHSKQFLQNVTVTCINIGIKSAIMT